MFPPKYLPLGALVYTLDNRFGNGCSLVDFPACIWGHHQAECTVLGSFPNDLVCRWWSLAILEGDCDGFRLTWNREFSLFFSPAKPRLCSAPTFLSFFAVVHKASEDKSNHKPGDRWDFSAIG